MNNFLDKYAYFGTSCDITFKVINFLVRCYTLKLIQSQFNLLDQSLCKKLEESNHAETLISLWTDLALCFDPKDCKDQPKPGKQ